MKQITRRKFLKASALFGGSLLLPPMYASAYAQRKIGENDVIRLAGIGVGGMGRGDLSGLRRSGCRIVALCDADLEQIKKFNRKENNCEDARIYQDYMRMLDEMGDEIDAVTVSTCDHVHCEIALECMKRGKHVYVQKPMAHTPEQAMIMAEAARKYPNVVTQMGNQGQSRKATVNARKWIEGGFIGDVKEVYCFTNRAKGVWAQGMQVLPKPEPIPLGMNWTAYLGKNYTEQQIPFGNGFHPFAWRGWYMFGAGALGDMAVHICAPVFYALGLAAPTSVYAETDGYSPVSYPNEAKVVYEFPARGNMPPVKVTWYESKKLKEFAELIPEAYRGLLDYGGRDAGCAIYIGTKGAMITETWADGVRLAPETMFRDLVKDKKIDPKAIGLSRDENHYSNFLRAIRGEEKAASPFEWAGPFVCSLLVGSIAERVPGKKLEWDGGSMKFKGDGGEIEFANKLVKSVMPDFPKSIYPSV